MTKATASGASNPYVQMLYQIPMEQALLFAFAISASLTLGALIYYFYNRQEKYDSTELEERLQRKVIAPMEKFGHKVERPLKYGLKNMGTVMKVYKDSTDIEMSRDERDDVKKMLKNNLDDYCVEEDEIESFVNSLGTVEGYGLVVKRPGIVDKPLYFVGELLKNDNHVNPYADYYEIPKEAVKDKDEIVISDNLDLVKSRGIYRADSPEGFQFIWQKAMSDMLEDMLQTESNIPEQLHALNVKHTEDVRLDKKTQQHISEAIQKHKEGEAQNATD